ncbi:hypothetical protein BDW62DRAFT_190124 [Aspergillus aurantiobrunneus]
MECWMWMGLSVGLIYLGTVGLDGVMTWDYKAGKQAMCRHSEVGMQFDTDAV